MNSFEIVPGPSNESPATGGLIGCSTTNAGSLPFIYGPRGQCLGCLIVRPLSPRVRSARAFIPTRSNTKRPEPDFPGQASFQKSRHAPEPDGTVFLILMSPPWL